MRVDYPTPVSQRSGCKIGWMTFATKKDALVAASVAKRIAKRQIAHGYDFGYCSPGSITKDAEGYEGCIP